jgi:hypothetical protein
MDDDSDFYDSEEEQEPIVEAAPAVEDNVTR